MSEIPTDFIVCFAKCWPCSFGEHADQAHTWMGDDDIEFELAKPLGERGCATFPTSADEWAALATERPCGCDCNRKHLVCPDPAVHATLYAAREQTARLNAQQRAAETAPGTCSWCGAATR